MNAKRFVEELSKLSFKNTFNPYSDHCEVYDYKDAPNKRRQLLEELIFAASKVEVDSIWIGRDLGHRGGRRTGLALTDDVHLTNHLQRWGVNNVRITKGEEVPERTAAVIWNILSQVSSPVFLWNVFPLHPYEEGNPFSNRSHNAKEGAAGIDLLASLIDILKPKQIIAIGNDAEKAAQKLNINCKQIKVRHPSYGGQNIFLKQMKNIYQIK